MKKTIRIYPAVMMSKDKKNYSFSADPIKVRDYSEQEEIDLRKEYETWVKFWKTQYLLEVKDRYEKLLYHEKIK